MRNTVWFAMSARRRGETRLTLAVMLGSDEWSVMKSAKMKTCPLRTSCHGLRGQKTFSSHNRPEKV